MGILTKEGLDNIANYKYIPSKNSFLDDNLNPIYYFFLNMIPKWMAPNLVTMCGLLSMLLCFFLICLYDTQLTKELPWWIYIICGLSAWAYNIFDALDGKQARRTNSSSGLGAIFDHSCDSFACFFLVLIMLQNYRVGCTPQALIYIGLAQIGFFFASWEEYHTHVVRISFHGFGVTEVQLILGIMNFMTAIFGPQIWWINLPTPDWAFSCVKLLGQYLDFDFQFNGFNAANLFCGGLCIFTLLLMILMSISVLKVSKTRLKSFSYIIPIGVNTFILFSWYGSRIYDSHAFIILFIFGISTAFLTTKIIIFSQAKMDYPIFHGLVIFSLIFPIYRFFDLKQYLGITGAKESLLMERIIFLGEAGAILFWFTIYISVAIEEICRRLGIHCFTLTKRHIKKE